ncbi:MAG TPA: M20/M25/M40 family metallo-hydrolase [Pyrinomonadaceae bacterium]|nr:M20/M25/M40 family metallo-hydrolase [Pyrinomonadaceae bacterium]
MIRRQFAALLLLFTLVVPYTAFAQQPQQEDPMIAKIKDEGMNRSQVMQTLSYLTDVIGPRLTASPGMKRSNEWTRDTLAKWGLQNAHLEAWGPFGRGWSLKRFSAQVSSPMDIPLIAYPKAWSPSVKVVPDMPAAPPTGRRNATLSTAPPPVSNTVTADVVFMDAKTESDLDKYKGQLKGKIVLLSQPVEVKAMFEAPGRRQDEKSLLALANALPPGAGGGFGGGGGGGRGPNGPQMSPQERAQQQFQQAVFTAKRWNMLLDEGAAVAVDVSPRGSGGTLFVQSATVAPPIPKTIEDMRPGVLPRMSPYDPKSEARMIPQITVAPEHYNRMIRMIQQGEKLKMTVDLAVEYQDADNMGYNTVAEIPGTDLKDEIVMLGGHMDSWHSGTGATDNGAGVAVAMEAVRILQTLGLKPRRTIRIALWTGEEQGLLGSRAYVAQHFGKLEGGPQFGGGGGGNANATPAKLTTLPEYEKFSGYFNLDNGTGKIRGVYLQGNAAVRELFARWLMPFRDMGASTITISNTGGTDHQSFDGIGLPGFQFIQDEIEYDTRTHHSNQDLFDRIQADDMKQAATIMAAFVYNTAMRDEKLPRKPAPGARATSTTTNQ